MAIHNGRYDGLSIYFRSLRYFDIQPGVCSYIPPVCYSCGAIWFLPIRSEEAV